LPDIPAYDESALMQQIAEGDEKAFAELYRIYVPLLTPFIYGITKQDVMVEEMIQEAFLRLWMNRDKLAEINNPRGWIFRITANICYTWLKRKITERSIVQGMELKEVTDEISPEETVDSKILIHEIKIAVDGLPPARKKIYQMSREQGMAIPEIATSLGLSTQTVKNTLTKSLQAIREHLQSKGYTISMFYVLMSIIKIFKSG
jgi:RNA polymerase sigma-70 factor (family 1)